MGDTASYARVSVSASGVVPAPVEAVWSLVRVFSSIGQWLQQEGFASFHSELLPGHLEGQIGSCRIITLDGQSFVEQLEGLDDIKHILRYKVISHPHAVNPWPFAFLNFQARIQLRPVSLTNETFMEYEGDFDTEWAGVEEMERSLLHQLQGGVRGLQKIFAKPPTIGMAPTKPVSNGPAIGATNVPAYRGQNPSLYSHVTPNPAGYAEQQQQQYQQQQPGYQPGYRQDYVQQQPSTAGGGPLGLDPQEGFAQAGAQQGGASHGSLADYHPASEAGRRKQDSGGTDISTRSDLVREGARDGTSPTARVSRSSLRGPRTKSNSGYSST